MVGVVWEELVLGLFGGEVVGLGLIMNARSVLKEWTSGVVWVGLGYAGIIDWGEWIGQCGLGNMD